MITTSRADEFKGYVAIDHRTYAELFNKFLQKNSIDPISFVGIDAEFPAKIDRDIIDLKILFKSDDELKAKNVEIQMSEFFNLFTRFRVAFAPRYNFKEFEENVDSVFEESE